MRDIRSRIVNNRPYFAPVLTHDLADALRPGHGICAAQGANRRAKAIQRDVELALGLIDDEPVGTDEDATAVYTRKVCVA